MSGDKIYLRAGNNVVHCIVDGFHFFHHSAANQLKLVERCRIPELSCRNPRDKSVVKTSSPPALITLNIAEKNSLRSIQVTIQRFTVT